MRETQAVQNVHGLRAAQTTTTDGGSFLWLRTLRTAEAAMCGTKAGTGPLRNSMQPHGAALALLSKRSIISADPTRYESTSSYCILKLMFMSADQM